MLSLTFSLCSGAIAADTQGFDTELLKNRGLDASIGHYFADTSRYLPGVHPVALTVNGKEKGTVMTRFSSQGELCADRAFLHSAGLIVTDNTALDEKGKPESCHDYRKDFPSATIIPHPEKNGLTLVVPDEALSDGDGQQGQYDQGGTASLLNYSLLSTRSMYSGGSNKYSQADIEEGMNFDDWIARSRQIISKSDDSVNTENLYTYLQRSFPGIKKLMQVGQINISDTLFSVGEVYGIQFTPEHALLADKTPGTIVHGFARTAQARVEISQAGTVVYSTLVPAGPFTLSHVPATKANTALTVAVKETDGSESHFVIPAEAVQQRTPQPATGLSFAVGQIQKMETDSAAPYLGTLTGSWALAERVHMGGGVMLAQQYEAGALDTGVAFTDKSLLTSTFRTSRDERGHNTGRNVSLSFNYNPINNLLFSASASRYTSGYRELQDTLQDDFTHYAGQYSSTLSWNTESAGVFSTGYILNKGTDGEQDSHYLNLSWGYNIDRANISVTWQSQLDHTKSDNDSEKQSDGDMFFVNLTVPIGEQRISTYLRNQGKDTHEGVQLNGLVNAETDYSLSVEQEQPSHENTFNGNINTNLHYTQFSAGAGQSGNDNQNYNANLSGGIVADSQGVVFSPYKIQDTFAVARVTPSLTGVEIMTPEGNVWTDYWGQAIIPALSPYHKSRIEIQPLSLPENIEITNGVNIVSAHRGAASKINFNILDVRRVLLHVHNADRSPLLRGAIIVDDVNNYSATVIDDGLIFLPDAKESENLYELDSNGDRKCSIHIQLKKTKEPGRLYEETDGVCK